MGRLVRDWTEIDVDQCEVAPHRYRWTGTIGPDGTALKDVDLCKGYHEAIANVPYRVGDVVYIETFDGPAKARICHVGFTWNRHHERRETYRVQRATKNGTFSKLWEQTHPGFIQRGYQQAGLAPEMPDEQDAA